MIIEEKLLTEMKNEAITRMEKLLLDKNIIDIVKTEWKVYISDEKSIYEMTDDVDYMALSTFNSKNIGLAYIGIKSHNMISFLYISSDKEEWEQELELINLGCQSAFVYNFIYPDLSEIGDIFLDSSNHKLKRIG